MHISKYGHHFYVNDIFFTKLPDGRALRDIYRVFWSSQNNVKFIYGYIDIDDNFVLTNDFINDIEYMVYFLPLNRISAGEVGYFFGMVDIIDLFDGIIKKTDFVDIFSLLMKIVIKRDKSGILKNCVVNHDCFVWNLDKKQYINFLYNYFVCKNYSFVQSDTVVYDLEKSIFKMVPVNNRCDNMNKINRFPLGFFEKKRKDNVFGYHELVY